MLSEGLLTDAAKKPSGRCDLGRGHPAGRGPGTELPPPAEGPLWARAPQPALVTVVGVCAGSSCRCHMPVGHLCAVTSSLQVPLPLCEVRLLGCSLDSPRVSPGIGGGRFQPGQVPVARGSILPSPAHRTCRGQEGRREGGLMPLHSETGGGTRRPFVSCLGSDRQAVCPQARPTPLWLSALKPLGTAPCHVT